MSQRTLLLIAILILLCLLAAWLYLFLFGAPNSREEVFNNLNLGGDEDTGIVIEPPVVDSAATTTLNVRPRLRQLTTRPVIGFIDLPLETTPLVRFVEAGTGHVYDVDTETGQEERVSNFTIAEAAKASLNPTGVHVAVKASNDRRVGELSIGTINSDEPTWFPLKKNVIDFGFLTSGELLYTERSENGIIVTAYDVATGTSRNLYTVPFFEAIHVWGTSSEATHFVYNRPSHALESYLYQFEKERMSRINAAGYGFFVLPYQDVLAITNRRDGVPFSAVYSRDKKQYNESPLVLLPEKCSRSEQFLEKLWCGAQIDATMPFEFPDTWYRGDTSFDDDLYVVSLFDGAASVLIDIKETSGREIDVINMRAGHNERALYFVNRNDGTLWMYEL